MVDKKERQERPSEVKKAAIAKLVTEDTDPERLAMVKRAFAQLEKDIIRRPHRRREARPDGRAADEIRPISCEVGVIPRTHGTALFTRGQTQALTLLTLGGTGEYQRIDGLGIED